MAGGRLIVAGQFTNVDGVTRTSGLAALDPITGDVDPTWRASLTVSGTTARPIARALDVQGDWIYVGGNFTSVAGSTATRSVGRLARVAIATGNADTQFRPNVGGVPYDVDAAADGRAYVVGSFTAMNGQPRQGMAIVDAVTGALVPGMGVTQFTSATKQYQQAVVAVGPEVWQGGSEHNTHAYSQADYSLLQRYVTADQGGDTQVLTQAGGTVYQGSHGNAWIYRDATTWPSVTGYTRADVYNWIGAFDVATRNFDAVLRARHPLGLQRRCVGVAHRRRRVPLVRWRLQRRPVRRRNPPVPRGLLQVLPGRLHRAVGAPQPGRLERHRRRRCRCRGGRRPTTPPDTSATRCCATIAW